LQQAVKTVTSKPAYLAALEKQSTFPFNVPPEKAGAFLAAERARWEAAVKSSGATATE
jgi:tripartite-type tricarboxylate transporter receptor subunit TctC